jgi:hypothetical protein
MASLYGVAIGGGLTGNVDTNRVADNDLTTIKNYSGRPLTWLLIDFDDDVSAELNEGEAVMETIKIIEKYATIVIRGDLFDTGSQLAIAIEQTNESQDWDGNGATTLAQQIDDEMNALGTINSIDMTAASCTVKTSLNIS